MTAFTDTKSVEARKAIYSQELATYTRRQWDMVRRTIEDEGGSQTTSAPSQQQETANVPPDSGTTSRLQHGVRACDYAYTTHRRLNGQCNIATGKA